MRIKLMCLKLRDWHSSIITIRKSFEITYKTIFNFAISPPSRVELDVKDYSVN